MLAFSVKTMMGKTDVLFIFTPVPGQSPGFADVKILVAEISLELPARETV